MKINSEKKSVVHQQLVSFIIWENKYMKKILIVEDDNTISNELKELLINSGYKAEVLEDFQNSKEKILESQADLILLDINIPGINGEILLKEIRKVSDVPIIMVTSRTSEVDEVLTMSYGADDFITKPYSPTVLLLRIQNIFKRMEPKSDRIRYKDLEINITIVYIAVVVASFLIDFFRKKNFYDEFTANTEKLDKKYLVLEMLKEPEFYEGKILYDNLYEIDKSMAKNVNKYNHSIEDFKEYIEMWIHEVKIPIASLVLMCHNHKGEIDEKYIKQIRRLDNYTDQVLYYIRSNYSENDYLIKEVGLNKAVGEVLIKNRDDLLENKINIQVDLNNYSVFTDSKWFQFILNQIINNSIKYKKAEVESIIKITASQTKDETTIEIFDNGIGIPRKDLKKVFNKSFTGENGRIGAKSTGMGLYIADRLCKKLGHRIEIESEQNVDGTSDSYTKVKIVFGRNDYLTLQNCNVK